MTRRWKKPPAEVSRSQASRRPLTTRSVFWFLAALVWTVSIGLGIAVGWTFTSVSGLAERVRELEHMRPSLASVVYDAYGHPIHEFAVQKRIPVDHYNDIPPLLRGAILAVEDDDFFQHPGVNPLSILRAIYQNIKARRLVQGGSTITQQLAKMLFLTPERTLDRKIKEIFLALQLEKHFTKQEIFLYYYNNVYLGHGVYGFEAAARYYFGKRAKDLEPDEAALLAGLVRAPGLYSPYRNPDRAVRRRNYCLWRMVREKVISQATYERAIRKPLRVIVHEEKPVFAPYFVEEIRRYVNRKYGAEALYHRGLKIHTTLDPKAQRLAEKALEEGLYALARRQPWSGPLRNVLDHHETDPQALATYRLPEWPRHIHLGERYPVLIMAVERRRVTYRIGGYVGIWNLKDLALLKTTDVRRRLRPGDVVMAQVKRVDVKRARVQARLENYPRVEGAIVVLDPLTGEVRAMVGGLDFQRSQFNRVTQARRQVGSAFKPFVWTAAIEAGLSMSNLIEDAPFAYEDPFTHELWEPGNFDQRFLGWVTLRKGLELSRNTVAARLITHVGIDRVIDVARRAGIQSPIPPYPSIALGTLSATPLEITAAYAPFANGGFRIRPYWIRRIEDRYGRPLEVHTPDLSDAFRPDVAFVMTWALRGVILRGTAAAYARDLPFEAAGKTGTTDEFTNAWFIGFTPTVLCGVWVGFDEPQRLGYNETGAHAALPIWVHFMRAYLENTPSPQFDPPGTVVMVPVDYDTGLRATPTCRRVILEAYVPGTEPLEYCSSLKHQELIRPVETTGHP